MKNSLRAAITASVLLFSSVSFAATPADTLVVAQNINDIISLDPAECLETTGIQIDANIYDRIVRFDPEDATKLVGGVAESWAASEDGKTFELKIRTGLKFASGNPIRPEDVAFSLRRVIKLNKNPAFLVSQLGWTKENVDEMVKPLDSERVQVKIAVDFSPTLVVNIFASMVGAVVDEKLALSHEKNGDLGNEWLKTNSAGSGAFSLKSWKANDSVVLEANPLYRDGQPKMKRVVVRNVTEPATQRLLLQKSDIDVALGLVPDQLKAIGDDDGIAISTVPQGRLVYVGMNSANPILDNVKVRQGLRYLVDYAGIVNSLFKDQYTVHQSFWPAGMWSSYEQAEYNYDPARAKELLKEAGYPDGFDIFLDSPNSSPYINMAQAIQASMAKGNVRVKIVPSEQKALLTKYRARQHEMLLLHYAPDYMDPHSNADTFMRNVDNSDKPATKPVAWRNSWTNPEINAEVDAAVRETDASKREQMYVSLQKRGLAESPYIFMFQETQILATRADVKNFVLGPIPDTVSYEHVSK